jgi:[heparan sulfate]-glucosamine 3-sulfotransferase 5
MPLARPDQIVVTKTPGMLDIPNYTSFLERLRQALPDIKLLMVVKNPIDRVVSDVLHEFKEGAHKGEPMPPIDDVIMHRAGNFSAYRFTGQCKVAQKYIFNVFSDLSEAVLYMSDYDLQFKMLTEVFPRENIFVVNGEMIVQNPLDEIKRVETFLGLSPFFRERHFVYPEDRQNDKMDRKFPCFQLGQKAKCMFGDKGWEHPPLKNETYDFLKKEFQLGLDKFEQETGVGFEM